MGGEIGIELNESELQVGVRWPRINNWDKDDLAWKRTDSEIADWVAKKYTAALSNHYSVGPKSQCESWINYYEALPTDAKKLVDEKIEISNKWPNMTLRKCEDIRRILCELKENIGYLPEEKGPFSNELLQAGYLQEYTERVLSDKHYQSIYPQSHIENPELVRENRRLFRELSEALDECR